ncbi:hypothetical protein AAFF_G00032430 [Aldrovandia affinis]|uniref:Uncharacterized protein n=1 Tax=Aldrovandia affinis TaxID=143900 RepID=A0AAD7S3W2_9TELE|nr:hypothetical protein AAFF_G00032430 [Aldrovandia affinis]
MAVERKAVDKAVSSDDPQTAGHVQRPSAAPPRLASPPSHDIIIIIIIIIIHHQLLFQGTEEDEASPKTAAKTIPMPASPPCAVDTPCYWA